MKVQDIYQISLQSNNLIWNVPFFSIYFHFQLYGETFEENPGYWVVHWIIFILPSNYVTYCRDSNIDFILFFYNIFAISIQSVAAWSQAAENNATHSHTQNKAVGALPCYWEARAAVQGADPGTARDAWAVQGAYISQCTDGCDSVNNETH